jgi:hypothetical protein
LQAGRKRRSLQAVRGHGQSTTAIPGKREAAMSERTLQVNDGVGGAGFVAVPRHMLGKLSPNALALWVALLSHGWRDGRCYPGQETLMAETQLGEHPLRKAKKELVAAGLLDETRRGQGKANLYRVRLQSPQNLESRNDDSSSLVANPSSPEVEEGEVEEEDSLRSSSSSSPENTTEPSRPTSEQRESNVKSIPAGSCMSNDISRATVLSLFSYWRTQCGHPTAKLKRDRERKIVARLREGYTEADIRRAIDGAAKHAFVNENGVRFDDLELICRSSAKLEGFIERASPSAAGAQQATVAELMAAYERPRARTGV